MMPTRGAVRPSGPRRRAGQSGGCRTGDGERGNADDAAEVPDVHDFLLSVQET